MPLVQASEPRRRSLLPANIVLVIGALATRGLSWLDAIGGAQHAFQESCSAWRLSSGGCCVGLGEAAQRDGAGLPRVGCRLELERGSVSWVCNYPV